MKANDEPSASTCHQSLQVVADKTRLAILRRLMESPCHVGEINQVIQIEQSLLSHHLRVLRESGLVTSRRDGKAVLYDLAENARAGGRDGIDLGCCRINFDN